MRNQDREKFVRLATRRVNAALKQFRLIGNLSNRSNYDYTEADAERIFKALQTGLSESKKRFSEARRQDDAKEFTLE